MMSDNYTPKDGEEKLTYIPFACLECCYTALRERDPSVEPCRTCGYGPGGAV